VVLSEDTEIAAHTDTPGWPEAAAWH
jgi:hypothetical protein